MTSIIQRVDELSNHLARAEMYSTLSDEREKIAMLRVRVNDIQVYLRRMAYNVDDMAHELTALSHRISVALDENYFEMHKLLSFYNNMD